MSFFGNLPKHLQPGDNLSNISASEFNLLIDVVAALQTISGIDVVGGKVVARKEQKRQQPPQEKFPLQLVASKAVSGTGAPNTNYTYDIYPPNASTIDANKLNTTPLIPQIPHLWGVEYTTYSYSYALAYQVDGLWILYSVAQEVPRSGPCNCVPPDFGQAMRKATIGELAI